MAWTVEFLWRRNANRHLPRWPGPADPLTPATGSSRWLFTHDGRWWAGPYTPGNPGSAKRREAQLGRLLDRYKISFFYEQPTLIHDRGWHRIWHPDFTLPGINGLIIEYAGMPDVPDYMAGIRHKQRVYRANEIAALFVYPQQLRGPNWPEKLIKRVYREVRQPPRHGYGPGPGARSHVYCH